MVTHRGMPVAMLGQSYGYAPTAGQSLGATLDTSRFSSILQEIKIFALEGFDTLQAKMDMEARRAEAQGQQAVADSIRAQTSSGNLDALAALVSQVREKDKMTPIVIIGGLAVVGIIAFMALKRR